MPPTERRIATTHELMLPYAADLVRMRAKGASHGQMLTWLHSQGVMVNMGEIASFWPYLATQKQKPPQTPQPGSNSQLLPCRADSSRRSQAKAEASAKAETNINQLSTNNPQPKTNKMPSEAQIAANRLNAQKSTGPRTDVGKAASSRNALKHTALAQALLVSSRFHMESADDFLELCAEYHSALDPVGPLEEMLIEQIVTAVWRTRRAHQAEAGEIALNLEEVDKKKDEINPIQILLKAAEATNPEDVLSLLDNSIPGCEFILARLDDARAAIRRDGRLTLDTLHRFDRAFRCRAKALTEPLYEMVLTLETNPGKLDPAILLQIHQADLYEYFDRLIQHFEELLASRRANPEARDRARRDAAMLPNANTLNKILRYETVLQKQIFSAMNQLEKLQSRRRQTETSAQNSHESSGRVAAPSAPSVPSCSKSVPETSAFVPSGADHRLPPCRADLTADLSSVPSAIALATAEGPAEADPSSVGPAKEDVHPPQKIQTNPICTSGNSQPLTPSRMNPVHPYRSSKVIHRRQGERHKFLTAADGE